jgi:hypothetical protein
MTPRGEGSSFTLNQIFTEDLFQLYLKAESGDGDFKIFTIHTQKSESVQKIRKSGVRGENFIHHHSLLKRPNFSLGVNKSKLHQPTI